MSLRGLVLVGAAMLVLLGAACNGGDDDETPTSTATGEPEPTTTSEKLGGVEPGTAVVTVGDETWTFTLDTQCLAEPEFELMSVASSGEDGSGARVTASFRRDGADITVLDETNAVRWAADPSQGEPIEYTMDERAVSGTTTFEDGDGNEAAGQFAIACP